MTPVQSSNRVPNRAKEVTHENSTSSGHRTWIYQADRNAEGSPGGSQMTKAAKPQKEKTSVKKLSYRHEAIAKWILANPEKRLGDCAKEFGITQAWLSVLINSDIFRNYISEMRDKIDIEFQASLTDKLTGVAHRAAEKLGEQVEVSGNADFLLDVVDKTAKLLGHGPRPGGATINVNQPVAMVPVDQATLHEARQMMAGRFQEAQQEIIEVTPEEGSDAPSSGV